MKIEIELKWRDIKAFDKHSFKSYDGKSHLHISLPIAYIKISYGNPKFSKFSFSGDHLRKPPA